jgi:hypothetical protein
MPAILKMSYTVTASINDYFNFSRVPIFWDQNLPNNSYLFLIVFVWFFFNLNLLLISIEIFSNNCNFFITVLNSIKRVCFDLLKIRAFY